MTAELALSDDTLDQLLELARIAEAEGRIDDALGALTVVLAATTEQAAVYQHVFEWMADLESRLGNRAPAERHAGLARELAEAAARPDEVFRMDVLRARIACEQQDLALAETILANLVVGDRPLGAVRTARPRALMARLDTLGFPQGSPRELAMLRAELTLVIIELWSERGRYRSALRLFKGLEAGRSAAPGVVHADQVELLRVELLVAAGRLTEATRALDPRADPRTARTPGQITSRRLTQATSALDLLADPPTALARARIALVRVRAALAGGQLAQADRALAALADLPPGDPMLFASAAATRIAVEVELNELGRAHEIARAAQAALAGIETVPEAAQRLIERAIHDLMTRGRSSLAQWELPYVAGAISAPPPYPAAEPAGARWQLTTAWTAAANAVLFALERGDLEAAAAEQHRLEALTADIESDYVAARVALSAAMIAYYRDDGDVAALLAIAARLEAVGARLATAQALRFAGWVAARQRRYDDHAALARRVSAIIDQIHDELPPARRGPFMRNKWSGRDELVSHLLRAALAGGGAPEPRALCRTFREIDRLTHQPIDEVLGDLDAATLDRDATAHEVRAWLGHTAQSRARRARTGLAIHSPWSLRRIPARTLILHYHVLPDRTFLFRIARRHIDVQILPYGRIHFGLDMRAAADDNAQLRDLAASTGIAGAIERFPDTDRLIIVPHDALASVPFAALPVGERRLCELGPIVQLDRIGRLRRRAWRARRTPLISVGRAHYAGGTFAGARLGDLPAAEREATAVAALAGGGAPPLLDATLPGVLAALPRAARLHVAAHGVFDHARPARSGIVLGDAAGGYATLTLHQLRALDLRALQLATLATCRSAQHAQLPGRERISLPTALLDAGARGVIASLWPVEDAPSVAIMQALYAELRTHRPAVALARMQAALARRPAAERPPARQWAGLVFYGNE